MRLTDLNIFKLTVIIAAIQGLLPGGESFLYAADFKRKAVIKSALDALSQKNSPRDRIITQALDSAEQRFQRWPDEKIPPEKDLSPKPQKSEKPQEHFDFGAPPETNISLDPELSMGVTTEVEYRLEKSFDLNRRDADDRVIFDSTLALAFSYIPEDTHSESEIFVSLEGGYKIDDDAKKGKKIKTSKLELQQAFVSVSSQERNSVPLYNLRLGRQRFRDRREWIYDEELDGMRLSHRFSRGSLEFSASQARDRDLLGEIRVDKKTNYAFFAAWTPKESAAAKAYTLIQDDRTSGKNNPYFYGLQLSGQLCGDDLEYWLDYALVRGKDSSKKIRAFGFDAGVISKWNAPLTPSLTFGYAYGSGDDNPSDGIDKNFRQSGLQDNEGRFNGIANFKYYGALFDPELSNLAIFTTGIGIRLAPGASLDFVYHNYRQNQVSNRIRDSEIDKRPDGINKALGQEIDSILGYRYNGHLRFSLILGYFLPAEAFSADADNALFSEVKVRYSF